MAPRTLPAARLLYEHDAFVGEGPVWDPRIGRLVWVDIPNNHVFTTDPATGEEHVLVRERIRTIGVVQHVGDHEVRPTVMMQVCIADRLLDIEVSLTDRSAFNYLLLLGRSALASFALIDPSETFLSDAECALPGPDAEAAS